MMELHQGLPVHGYAPQPTANIEMVNQNKLLEEQCLRVLDTLADLPEVDMRWLAIARTHLEISWMAANRAILQPRRIV